MGFFYGQAEEWSSGGIPDPGDLFQGYKEKPGISLEDLKNLGELFFLPANKTKSAVTSGHQSGESFFRLIGTIIEDGRPNIAFISDTSGNQSSRTMYYESDRIKEWTVTKIKDGEVTLTNGDGRRIKLTIQGDLIDDTPQEPPFPPPQPPPPTPQPPPSDPWVPPPDVIIAIYKIWDKATPLNEVDDIIDSTTGKIPRATIVMFMGKAGIPSDVIPEGPALKEYLKRLARIYREEIIAPPSDVMALTFASQVNADNSPATPANTFPAGKYKIYTCFANTQNLKGASKVYIRWKNQGTNETLYVNGYSVNPSAAHNFAWLQPKDGWQKGVYEVEAFNINTLGKVAIGTYKIE